MEDIKEKAESDQFNKAEEEIQKFPKKYIPVPKPTKKKKNYA